MHKGCLILMLFFSFCSGASAQECLKRAPHLSVWKQCNLAKDCEIMRSFYCGIFYAVNGKFVQEVEAYDSCRGYALMACPAVVIDPDKSHYKVDCVKNKCVVLRISHLGYKGWVLNDQ